MARSRRIPRRPALRWQNEATGGWRDGRDQVQFGEHEQSRRTSRRSWFVPDLLPLQHSLDSDASQDLPESKPTTLLLYPTLAAFFDPSNPAQSSPTKLELPFYPSTSSSPEHISSISSGASHFLVLAFPSYRLFSLGDNRYGQLGVPHTSVRSSDGIELHRVDAFDGLRISQISTGAFHSVALTESGECYFFGSDQQGQCGGTGGGWEPTVNETLDTEYEGDEAYVEVHSMSDIMQVCAFGESTVLRTRAGQIWVAGASEFPSRRRYVSQVLSLTSSPNAPHVDHSGQLGFELTKESLTTFTKHLAFGADDGTTKSIGKVMRVVCSRSTVYLEVEESATG